MLAALLASLLGPGALFGGLEPRPSPSPADYRHLELHELVLTADRIVVGEIISLHDSSYRLSVSRTLAGEPVAAVSTGEC